MKHMRDEHHHCIDYKCHYSYIDNIHQIHRITDNVYLFHDNHDIVP